MNLSRYYRKIRIHNPQATREELKVRVPLCAGFKKVWRSVQSFANPSPTEFPANREKYKGICEFLPSKMHPHLSKLQVLVQKIAVFSQIITGGVRDISGNESP